MRTEESRRAVSQDASSNTKAICYNVPKVTKVTRVAPSVRLVWEDPLRWMPWPAMDQPKRIVVSTFANPPSKRKIYAHNNTSTQLLSWLSTA
jgi:hypothetical protein